MFGFGKKKILIIEDDESTRNAIADKLSREGYSVITAADGSEGSRLAFEEKPDVILLDLMLPLQDGAAVLSDLRSDPNLESTPVIIMSNLLEDPELMRKYKIAGYIVKSDWKMEDVVAKVKEVL